MGDSRSVHFGEHTDISDEGNSLFLRSIGHVESRHQFFTAFTSLENSIQVDFGNFGRFGLKFAFNDIRGHVDATIKGYGFHASSIGRFKDGHKRFSNTASLETAIQVSFRHLG